VTACFILQLASDGQLLNCTCCTLQLLFVLIHHRNSVILKTGSTSPTWNVERLSTFRRLTCR